ncbi:hypothetical protein [Aequorivita vladivostokensis]|uniref:Uncharacterized protein n=1 Tax=Aequorivita vladivostokensis TaxID=171194 RepID=A0ABR5DIM9_9FLAO|nr:hypothetical protein [Aequorivita vladivostokensis]KJJ38623.1 hypothetical protein MB09_08020 [Aequorivita vladivostokensis]
MNKFILLIGLCVCSNIFSQEIPSYKDITSELINPENSLNITLNIFKSDFYIIIENDIKLSRYYDVAPCMEFKSNSETNKAIQDILLKNKLLEIIYVHKEEQLVRIDSKEKIIYPLYWITIEYKTEKHSRSVILPVFEKNISEQILNDFSKVFPNQNCFSILQNKL